MEKAQDAFRTISEVADLLDTPAHVLRFWESRFPQVRPVKRAGGRRYYRPTDIALLSGIKRLLHNDGLTIRGVQKLLREQGIRHVMELAADRNPEWTSVLPEDTPDDHGSGEGAGAGILTFPEPAGARSAVSAARLPLWMAPADGGLEAPPYRADGSVGSKDISGGDIGPDPSADAGSQAGTLPAEETVHSLAAAGTADPFHLRPDPVAAVSPVAIKETPADLAPLIAARLRSLTPHGVARHRADLVILAARLGALRARLADAAAVSGG